MTEDEYNAIRELAKENNAASPSDYIRKAAVHCRIIKVDNDLLRKTFTLVNRLSNNANQIAKVANSTGNVYKQDIDSLLRGVKEIWRLQASILSVLQNI